MQGADATRRDPARIRALARLLGLMAGAQAAFLAARYLYQFKGLAGWFDAAVAPIGSILTVEELGLSE